MLRRDYVIVLCFFLIAIAIPTVNAAATFNCTIRTSCFSNNESILIRLNSSEPLAAPNNSHAQLANFSGTAYSHSVCCWTDLGHIMNNSCYGNGIPVLKLNATSDSHVQAGSQTGYANYACLNLTAGNVTCEYPTTSCSAGYSPVVSIASSESADNNLTNAHVGEFALYRQKVCCQIGGQSPPVVAYANISPYPNATTRMNLECQNGSVSDADGDSVTLHYNWLRNNRSITELNLPMDYDSGAGVTHDISGYANHGTVTGATFLPTTGKIGGGFDFDGTSEYISTSTPIPTNNFSLSLWFYIKRNAVSRAQNENLLATNAWSLYQNPSNDFLYFHGAGGSQYINWAPTNNAWHHLACGVTTNASIVCYGDGAVKSLVQEPGTFGASTSLTVSNTSNMFNGTIDEVMIFNRSLSASELLTLYNLNNRWLNYSEIRRNETWNCTITPVDSTGLNGSTKFSNKTLILGSSPLNATLLYPTHNNVTVFERFVNFTWNASNELDGDQVNYSLNLTTSGIGGCAIQTQQTNLQTLNYTFGELCVDSYYNWTVQACDIDGCSGWASIFNFTIGSVTSIRLLNNNTNFGTLAVGQTIDTTGGVVAPFWVENDGNVFVNVTIVGNNSPYTSVNLNTTAFQYKARVNETNAFSTGTSQMVYTPLNSTYSVAFKLLNYTDSADAAFVDINVTVPINEPPGNKVANITFLATS